MAGVDVKSCAECGASIYPEHITTHKAGMWGGKLVCVHCYAEHQDGQVTIGPEDLGDFGSAGEAAVFEDAPGANLAEPVEETFALADADEGPTLENEAGAAAAEPQEGEIPKFVKPIGQSMSRGAFGPSASSYRFKRHLHHSEKGAIRCRIFHAKLNDGALKFMEEQINEWVDQNPDIEIKHASTNVGVVEGKSSEPHLIVTLLY